MNANKLLDLVSDGKYFYVKFRKKSDNTIREMTCRTGVKAYVKGTGTEAPEQIVRVWEASGGRNGADAYRCFDIESLIEAKIKGKVYILEDFE